MSAREWTQERSRDALEDFLCRHRGPVYRLALGIVGSPDVAEDVAQEVLIRASKHRNKIQQLENEQAWMRRITVRRAISHLRDLEYLGEPRERSKAEDLTQNLAVRQTLARLRPEQRAILALSCGEGLSYDEIAEALSIPTGTVGSRIHAAKAAFKKLWEVER